MQTRYKLVAPLILAATLPAAPTFAAGGTLEFAGAVLRTCAITVAGAGILDISANGTVLSSKTGLGTPALATIFATGSNFHVDVSNPASFSIAPSGGNGGITFETRYSMTGGTSFLNVASGTQTLLNIGTTTLSVDLSATKTSPFPAGAYVAQTTVTCE